MADEIATIISSLGLSNEAFLAIVLLAFVVIGAIIVIVATRPILDVYPYLHPNARVRARKGRLFDDKQISELVEANNVEEITNYLRGSPDYAEYLDNYTLEKALDIQLGETYDLVSRMAPKEIQSSFKVMAKKSDIANIKSLLTAKEAGLSQEATEELLVPTGSLYEDLQRLSDVDTVTDVVAGLDGTEYAPILEEVLPEYEKTETAKPISKMLINIIAILFAPSFCEISLIGFICFKIFAIFEYSPFLYVFCTIKYTLICEYITIAKR
mgnify:CR=1 FL=1